MGSPSDKFETEAIESFRQHWSITSSGRYVFRVNIDGDSVKSRCVCAVRRLLFLNDNNSHLT